MPRKIIFNENDKALWNIAKFFPETGKRIIKREWGEKYSCGKICETLTLWMEDGEVAQITPTTYFWTNISDLPFCLICGAQNKKSKHEDENENMFEGKIYKGNYRIRTLLKINPKR